MKPVYQSKTGKNGRCFSACLASILELPEQDVPSFLEGNQTAAADKWLAKRGMAYHQYDSKGAPAPIGWHIITGTSPRGGQHAVVGRDGRIVHDPHPHDGTGRGLADVNGYGVITRR
jgi:hypothetical protein